MSPIRAATVFTHRRPAETAPAIGALLKIALQAGAVLRFNAEERELYRLERLWGDAPVVLRIA